jgi:hypothetical protein
MGQDKYRSFVHLLSEHVDDVNAGRYLTDYLSSDTAAYTGRAFDTYGRDRRALSQDGTPTDANVVTGDDLIALTMLSIEIRGNTTSGVSPEAAIEFDRRQEDIRELLGKIPLDTELHSCSEEKARDLLLGKDSLGHRLWDLFLQILSEGQPRGKTTQKKVATFKLLARKRPHLFAIRDGDTSRMLGHPDKWWQYWWQALQESNHLVMKLESFRQQVPDAETLSLLRIADIIIWMKARGADKGVGALAAR